MRASRLPTKNTAFIGLIGLILLALVTTIFFRLASASCNQEYREDRRLNISGQSLKVQVVRTPADLSKGLGGKSCISADQAMLFEFNRPGKYSFWMKDMNFPIDIVWLDADRKVTQVKAWVAPETFPDSFGNKRPAQFVLELKAGQASRLDIEQGNHINL
jgi:uncharacterized membrane protein (UPF0127 family)